MKKSSVVAILFMATTLSVGAQMTGAPTAGYRQAPGMPASAVPTPLRTIGFDQHLNDRVPLDVVFHDEQGRDVQLGDFFGTKPVVLAFVYYDCPMLCTQVLSALGSSIGVMSLNPGKDFDVVIISFDPREKPSSAVAKKNALLERYSKPGWTNGWHFLTGDQPEIARLTAAAGFRYAWDADTKQFAHPTGIIVLTPDGRLARYLFGVEYGPRDLRLAIVEASEGRVGSLADALLLYCYHYDPVAGGYGLAIMRTIRAAGAVTVFALAAFIIIMVRRERKGGSQRTRPTHAPSLQSSAPRPQ
jgi:protein SCO1/2